MGSSIVGHNWAIEQQHQPLENKLYFFIRNITPCQVFEKIQMQLTNSFHNISHSWKKNSWLLWCYSILCWSREILGLFHFKFVSESLLKSVSCLVLKLLFKHAVLLFEVCLLLGSWPFFLVSAQLLNHIWLFVTPWTAAHQDSLSITNSRSCSNSCPLSPQCHPTISSSVPTFSSCLQSFPASGSFQMSQLFESGGQSIGTSASALPMNIQDWFLLGLTGLILLQS